VFHYTNDAGKLSSSSTSHLHISRAEEILNKQGGWNALAGTKNFGEIATSSDEKCKLAFDVVVDRVSGYVGSYYVSLQGEVDALVFAGGIGEKSPQLREAVTERTKCLGFSIDAAANKKDPEATVEDISGAEAKHRVMICQTDEQLEMVRMCASMNNK
jgi:acetate kinase